MPAEGEELQEEAALPSAIFDDDGRVSENRLKEYEIVVKDKAYKTIQAARGYNTSTAYCTKQVEYLLFGETVYASLPHTTRFLVTGDKRLTFLSEVVIDRPLRRSGVLYINDKTRANEEASASTSTNSSAQLRNIKASITNQGKKLSHNTCNIYVAAIVDLWNYQKLKGINSHESPRTKIISQLLKWVRKRGAADNLKNNIDRATSLQVSGYTTIEQVVAITRKMYNNPAQHYKHSFRNATAFPFSHYLLLRGESVRRLKLADILLQELPKIGAEGSYTIITMIFNRSKTNQFNKMQSGAFMRRNKNVDICAFMALSFHFFWRWHHNKEPPNPVAKNSRRKGKAPARGINDDESSDDDDNYWSSNPLKCPIPKASQARFMKAAFDSINLFARRKITHVPRGSATKMANNLGIPSSQISQIGQWSQDVMSNASKDSVPRHFIRKLAGFESDANYYLDRAIEKPPAKLKRLVFPMADYWYERHITKNVDDQTSGSANGFLLLLKCFQTTLLQDAAAMMYVILNHPIWKNELFTHPLFLDFRRKVKVHIDAREEPESELLKKVAPEVQDQLASMNRIISKGFKELARNQQATDASQQTMQPMFNNIVSGRQPLQLSVRLENSSAPAPAPSPASASSSASVSASASASASALVSAPVHKMSRGVHTVADLWKEWTLGLGGFWSIQDMDAKYGTAWRKDDRKWYNLRKKVIEAVKKLQNDLGLSPPTAIDTLQRVMSRRNWSIDRLGTELQKGSYDPLSDPKRQKVDDDR
ncbi:hypothetical protein [Parasitella parasitica]|uniref:Transcription activator GCR1-like domain-containing protein n=1 Tax=Parasitella parasitica TaxID=35722 RepID=A0A0B7NJW5_9FUNG|nr:hypothetical protein [Parasitella parasitica]